VAAQPALEVHRVTGANVLDTAMTEFAGEMPTFGWLERL
jgi:hypothetical protein